MYETEELEVTWDGKPAKVIVRELGFAEVEEAMQKAMQIKAFGSTTQASFDQKAYNQFLILKGITSAPFTINSDSLTKIRYKDGKRILNAIQRLTGLDENEKKTSSEKPTEEDTQSQETR